MRAFRDPLSYRSLWAIRWAVGTTIGADLILGALGLAVFSYPQPFVNFWIGGALATVPGYAVGLGIQRIRDPEALQAHRATVWILGAMSVVLFVIGLKLALGFPRN